MRILKASVKADIISSDGAEKIGLKNQFKTRDRHILKKDPKKWGTGDPLKFSNFFAKIVFLVLLYKTASNFF
jgi:hypothetical protein